MRFSQWIWLAPTGILALGMASNFVHFDTLETRDSSDQHEAIVIQSSPNMTSIVEDLVTLSLFENSTEVSPQNARGVQPTTETQPPTDEPFSYQFVGMTKTGGRHRLHFTHVDTEEKITLMFGDIIDGWNLTKIDGQSAELTRGETRMRLDLFGAKPEP